MQERSHSVDTGLEQQSMMLGNNSKDAVSWLNGPTHMMRKQSIPGYAGFIPGVTAENLIASTYALNTATSFSGKLRKGSYSQAERFKSVSQESFNHTANRRVKQDGSLAPKRDFIEYTITVNKSNNNRRKALLSNTYLNEKLTVKPTQFAKDLKGSVYNNVQEE
jgi:hypothetical protein